MAAQDFDIQLPDVQDNARTIGGTSGPSGAAIALSAIGDTLSMFQRDRERRAVRKRQAAQDARQAAEDAQKEAERSAKNSAAKQQVDFSIAQYEEKAAPYKNATNVEKVFGLGTNFSDVNTIDPETGKPRVSDQQYIDLQLEVNEYGTKIKQFDAAVAQGRIPGVGKQAQVDMAIRSLMSKHPGQEAVILEMFTQNEAFKDLALRGAQELGETMEAQADAERKLNEKYFERGFDSFQGDPELMASMTRDQFIALGRNQFMTDEAYNREKQKIDLQAQQTNISKQENDILKDQRGELSVQNAYNNLSAFMGPAMSQYAQLVLSTGEPGQSASTESRLAQLDARLRSTSDAYIAKLVQQSDNPDKESLRKTLIGQRDAMLSAYSNSRKGFTDAMGVMKTKFAIDNDLAAPFLTQIRQMGFDINQLPNVMEALEASDPSFRSRIANELKGIARARPGERSATLEVATTLSLLNGNETLSRIQDPAQAVKQVAAVARSVSSEASRVSGGQTNPDAFLNGSAVILEAATTIQNSTQGLPAAFKVLDILTGPQYQAAMTKSINDPSYGEEARVIAAGARAAAQQAYQPIAAAINSSQSRSQGWMVKWNNEAARYDVVQDPNWRPPSTLRSGGTGFMRAEMTPSSQATRGAVPTAIKSLADKANQAIFFLGKTGQWEPSSAPKGSEMEVRRFWARGTVTPTMAKQFGMNAEKQSGGSFGKAANEFEANVLRPLEQNAFSALATPEAGGGGGGSTIERNNNFGAIEDGAFARSQPGYVEGGGRFARFATPEDGIRAQETLLGRNYISKGFNTIDKVIDRYTPAHPENPEAARENYKNYIARRMGITRGSLISATQVASLAQAIREFETGNRR